jgi:hypothetical protein
MAAAGHLADLPEIGARAGKVIGKRKVCKHLIPGIGQCAGRSDGRAVRRVRRPCPAACPAQGSGTSGGLDCHEGRLPRRPRSSRAAASAGISSVTELSAAGVMVRGAAMARAGLLPGREGRIMVDMNAPRAATPRYLPGSPFRAPAPAAPAEPFAVHDQVTHDKYGLGVILGVEDHAVLVDFRPDQRRIPLPCAKLIKL